MQPVIEIECCANGMFRYRVRPPRSRGRIPAYSFHSSEFASLPACLLDAGRGMAVDFARAYVRYAGLCVGVHELRPWVKAPVRSAGEVEKEYRAVCSSPGG